MAQRIWTGSKLVCAGITVPGCDRTQPARYQFPTFRLGCSHPLTGPDHTVKNQPGSELVLADCVRCLAKRIRSGSKPVSRIIRPASGQWEHRITLPTFKSNIKDNLVSLVIFSGCLTGGKGGGEGVCGNGVCVCVCVCVWYWLWVRKFRRVRDNAAVRLVITPLPPNTHTRTLTIFPPYSSCVQCVSLSLAHYPLPPTPYPVLFGLVVRLECCPLQASSHYI